MEVRGRGQLQAASRTDAAATSRARTFKIDNGTILNTGSPHGYMYTSKKYWNFTFRLEYRLDPYEGMESDDDLFTNTGYFLFVNDHDVWPETLEIQGKNDFEMSLALGAAESTFKFDDAARARARKPAGQWNADPDRLQGRSGVDVSERDANHPRHQASVHQAGLHRASGGERPGALAEHSNQRGLGM